MPRTRDDLSGIAVRRDHLARAVRALVVIEEEAFGADELVELDPLAKIGRLVAKDGADREVEHLERLGPAPIALGERARRGRSGCRQAAPSSRRARRTAQSRAHP